MSGSVVNLVNRQSKFQNSIETAFRVITH